MRNNKGVPYYANHKIIDLTCPKCKSRVLHVINKAYWSEYKCRCGSWKKYIHYSVLPTGEKGKDWEYIADGQDQPKSE